MVLNLEEPIRTTVTKVEVSGSRGPILGGMVKRLLLVVVGVIILVGLYLIYNYFTSQPTVTYATQDEFGNLSAQVNNLNSIKVDYVDYQKQLGVISSELNTIQSSSSSSASSLQSEVDSCNTQISALTKQNTALQNSVNLLTAQFNLLNATVTNITDTPHLSAPLQTNQTTYLCSVAGVPQSLLFQYHFQCICNLRQTYGPYLDAGEVCNVNHDVTACNCYQTICDSKAGMC